MKESVILNKICYWFSLDSITWDKCTFHYIYLEFFLGKTVEFIEHRFSICQ